eukprot:1480423-Pyramimonas_sp.AAC.1
MCLIGPDGAYQTHSKRSLDGEWHRAIHCPTWHVLLTDGAEFNDDYESAFSKRMARDLGKM